MRTTSLRWSGSASPQGQGAVPRHPRWRRVVALGGLVILVGLATAGLTYRLDAALSVYGRYSSDSWDSRLGTRTGGELGVIDRPVDHLRLELVAARDPIVTRTSLEGGHSLLQWVLAANWSGIPRVQLHADGRAGFYSDGNRSGTDR